MVTRDPDIRPGDRKDLDVGWRTALGAGNGAVEQARNYLYCALRAQRWVHRRVDALSFIGLSRVSQRTSLDFSVPREAPQYAISGTRVNVLPLIPVEKVPLVGLDLSDDQGQDIPILTSRQNSSISVLGMLSLGDVVLEQAGLPAGLQYDYAAAGYSINGDRRVNLEFPTAADDDLATPAEWQAELREVQQAIVDLVAGDSELGVRRRTEFETADPEVAPLFAALWKRPAYRPFLRRLAVTYYLAVVLSPESRQPRRVVKFQLERRRSKARLSNVPLPDTRRLAQVRTRRFWGDVLVLLWEAGRALAERLGVSPVSVVTETNAAQDCESYHLELEAPRGLKIMDAQWWLRPPGKPTSVREAERRVIEDLGPRPVEVSGALAAGQEQARAHTIVRTLPLGYNVFCRWQMVPTANSWLLMAVPVTALAVAIQSYLVFGSPFLAPDDTSSLPAPANTLPAGGLVSTLVAGQGTVGGTGGSGAGGSGAAGALADPGSLLQNRMTLVLGVIAIATTVLLRSGENPLTKRLLLLPRVATVGLIGSLLISSLVLVLDPGRDAEALHRVQHAGHWLFGASVLALVAVTWCEVLAGGVVRKSVRRYADRRRRSERETGPDRRYWTVWVL